ncbi:hypothetical protein BJF90_11695 [Pseudonocardia sp. CNS-004]|nr:hypothetical protein BJF90_11695 [Pseudonocardia sp. CNS-004]
MPNALRLHRKQPAVGTCGGQLVGGQVHDGDAQLGEERRPDRRARRPASRVLTTSDPHSSRTVARARSSSSSRSSSSTSRYLPVSPAPTFRNSTTRPLPITREGSHGAGVRPPRHAGTGSSLGLAALGRRFARAL